MSDRAPLDLFMTTRALADGGAEKVWVTIARRFAERGDRVTLAIDRLDRDNGLDGIANLTLMDLGLGHAVSTARMVRALRLQRPDVALAAISGSCTKLVLASALARTRTPLVLSYHGFEEYKTGRLAAAAYYGMPFINRAAAQIVAVSDGLRDRLIHRWGATREKTIRIYNPVAIDLERAAASAVDLAERPPLLLVVARLSPEKGVDDMIRAFARVRHPDARLIVAGDGPDRAALEALARVCGVAERVAFAGHVADPSILYRQARVVVAPSRTEAFGLVLVEALAHGLPVVATACHGPVEILEGGRLGTLVPIGDPDSLAAAIDRALVDIGDPEPRIRRAAGFSIETGFRAWSDLIDGIVAERRGAQGRHD